MTTCKLFEVLHKASLFLEKNNCEPKIAEILLKHYLQVSDTEFYLMMQQPIPKEVMHVFKKSLHEHIETGIPVQYITGYEYFYGRKFFLTPDVLIPRPETEELVQHLINMLNQDRQTSVNIVDLGTGSGVIAVTLALEVPHVNVYATDLSQEALKIAKKNAEYYNVELSFMQGSFLQPMINKNITLDYIVANPPYIKTSVQQDLSRTVKDFEPGLALFAGANGLSAYQEIIRDIPKVIDEKTNVLFEIGHDQGESVSHLLKKQFPTSHIKVRKDIYGKDRIISAQVG